MAFSKPREGGQSAVTSYKLYFIKFGHVLLGGVAGSRQTVDLASWLRDVVWRFY